jgi:hypothetical protein
MNASGDATSARRAPAWLVGLGALAVVAILAALAYAVAIGVANFHRIGV